MPLSAYSLNKMTDHLVGDDFTSRPHTADPGSGGTTGQITGITYPTLGNGNWSNASAGDSVYNAAVAFGVLSATQSRTITHYSLWEGNNFVGSEALSAPVTVAANGTFTINSGTISINGAST